MYRVFGALIAYIVDLCVILLTSGLRYLETWVKHWSVMSMTKTAQSILVQSPELALGRSDEPGAHYQHLKKQGQGQKVSSPTAMYPDSDTGAKATTKPGGSEEIKPNQP